MMFSLNTSGKGLLKKSKRKSEKSCLAECSYSCNKSYEDYQFYLKKQCKG